MQLQPEEERWEKFRMKGNWAIKSNTRDARVKARFMVGL